MNTKQEIRVGTVVRIRCGRGAGRYAVVIGMTDTGRALVADGRRIGIDRPKMKSCKHLEPHSQAEAWDRISNGVIRGIITRLTLVS